MTGESLEVVSYYWVPAHQVRVVPFAAEGSQSQSHEDMLARDVAAVAVESVGSAGPAGPAELVAVELPAAQLAAGVV